MSLVRASRYLSFFSAVCAAAFVASCGYRPAHFADRPPVLSEDDEQPIALPRRGAFIPELHDASVYVRRELVNALEPRRPGEAKDVNALDEVPASSWFRRAAQVDKPLLGYKREGPPATPFTVTSDAPTSESPNARVILDARGRSYELVPDEPDRRGMRSGAGAAASRLFYAIGYRTAEVHVVTDEGGARFLATRSQACVMTIRTTASSTVTAARCAHSSSRPRGSILYAFRRGCCATSTWAQTARGTSSTCSLESTARSA